MITNLDRANWADKAVLAFREQPGCDLEDSLGDLLCDLMHWADARDFDFDASLHCARCHYQEEREEENSTVRPPDAVQDLVDALERQTEAARAVIDSWEKGDLAGAVHGLELSLDDSLAAIAKMKGGARATNEQTPTGADIDRILGLADQFIEDATDDEPEEAREWQTELALIRPLLCASPRLLAAAEKIIKASESGDMAAAIRDLNAAIAKAKGGAV